MKELNINNWYKAAYHKLKDLDKKRTYNMIPKSQVEERWILPLKWVFKYKFNINSALLKYKAYICVWDNLQIIEEKTYTIILIVCIFKIIIIIAAAFNLKIK